MIKEVSGDILLTEAQAIAHGVAPNDHFTSGLALSLREKHPTMYKDFRHYCHSAHVEPGGVCMWGGVGGVRVFNLLTQEAPKGNHSHPGKASIPNVNHALRQLAKQIKSEKITSLAIPKLATGVGGLDWEEVKPMIYARLGELGIPVYIYSTFAKGEKAVETGHAMKS